MKDEVIDEQIKMNAAFMMYAMRDYGMMDGLYEFQHDGDEIETAFFKYNFYICMYEKKYIKILRDLIKAFDEKKELKPNE